MSMVSLFKDMLEANLHTKEYLIGKLDRIRAFGDCCCTQEEYDEILQLINDYDWGE